MGNQYVDIQVQKVPDSTWYTGITATTETSTSNGNYGKFTVRWIPNTAGDYYIRAVYSGENGVYDPCVSDAVQLTVVNSMQ